MTEEPPIPKDLWDTIPPAARLALAAVFAEQRVRIAQLEAQVAELKARVKELEARLGQNSTNTSLPPSSDRFHVKPAPPRGKKGKKKKGGQPGHPKRSRPLLPPTKVIHLRPDACDGCGLPLTGDGPEPFVHQVVEIEPPPPPKVIEYRQYRLCCSGCGHVTCLPRPAEARTGFGPRVQAIAALLTGGYRLGKRAVARLFHDLFGVPISTGAVCKLQHRTADALAPLAAAARKYVTGRAANVDETSWKQGRKRQGAWLWVAAARWVTTFLIHRSRARAVLKKLIPGRPGLLTTDRLSVYAHLKEDNHQVCWAHLRRDFQALIDRQDEGRPIGKGLLACANRMLAAWKRVRDGTLTRQEFQAGPLVKARARFDKLVARWSECTTKKVRFACYELSQLGEKLWRFAAVDGVEPTNNAAERALRHAVCWRKTSYGTDTKRGSRFVECILTVVESCRQQGRNLLAFLTDAVRAARTGSPPPSLIPASTPSLTHAAA
jgi:transposase